MVEEKTRHEGAALGETQDAIVGTGAGEQVSKPGVGGAHVGDGSGVPERVVRGWVEEIDPGGGGRGEEAVDEVEGEGGREFGAEGSYGRR